MTEEKRCRKCLQSLPLSEFHRNARQEDGYQTWCKPCMNEYKAKRAERDAERNELLVVAADALTKVRERGRDALGQDKLEDELAAKVTELRIDAGLSRAKIAQELNVSVRRVDGLLARAKRLAWNGETREDIRQWAILQYEEQMEMARAAGNMTEARLAIGDMLKAAGIVSTGGNQLNVGIAMGGSRFEERVEALLKQEMETVDGEVVEDTDAAVEGAKQLPPADQEDTSGRTDEV